MLAIGLTKVKWLALLTLPQTSSVSYLGHPSQNVLGLLLSDNTNCNNLDKDMTTDKSLKLKDKIRFLTVTCASVLL